MIKPKKLKQDSLIFLPRNQLRIVKKVKAKFSLHKIDSKYNLI